MLSPAQAPVSPHRTLSQGGQSSGNGFSSTPVAWGTKWKGTDPADLVWPLVSGAWSVTLKALLMPCVRGAWGWDLVVPNPCVLLPAAWGPWWGQQECVGDLCLKGETPTTLRDCHQKLFGLKVLNLSEEELEAQPRSGCVGDVTLRVSLWQAR